MQKIDPQKYGVSRSLELLPALRGCLLRSQVKPTAADLCPPIFLWRRITCQDRLGTHKKETHQTHGVLFRSVTSNPNGLPFRLCGLMHAAWPWSGYYQATPQLWVTAHHTHFVKIGWRYLPVGSGTGLLVRTETHTPLSFQSRLFSALRKCHCQDRLETNKNPIRDNNRECLFLP